VRLAVARRPGVSEAELAGAVARVPDLGRVVFFDMPEVPVSSSDVRQRLAGGESVAGLVPEAVAEVIARLGLYGPPE
jgi:nicotinate-nucleotide adenylyltransferase